ncbi:hypothetical protein M8J75_012587 [Diaphorina citri]|nr:hypothetical protein M8J75_012587 [Diaphorina citri]
MSINDSKMTLLHMFVIVLITHNVRSESKNISTRNDASTSSNSLVNSANVPSSKPNDSRDILPPGADLYGDLNTRILPSKPICEPYRGEVCYSLLKHEMVYISPNTTQAMLEAKLAKALGVIGASQDLSQQCVPYTLPSLCFSSFPVCRKDSPAQPPRRICRQDCELLEDELCKIEYAIAKRHSLIGQSVPIEDCKHLPEDDSIESHACLQLGVPKLEPVFEDEVCYWGRGEGYRGSVNVAIGGLPCLPWKHQMIIKTSEHHELLGGHNYCRNPKSLEDRPWCYTQDNVRTLCDLNQCVDNMWLYLAISAGSCLILLLLFLIYWCCTRRSEKQLARESRLGSMGVTSKLSPVKGGGKGKEGSVELSALLPGSQASSLKSCLVREFHLSEVRFLQELGEGAFGKVYKGEVCTSEGPSLVAIKTLKENANQKTASDFRREVI